MGTSTSRVKLQGEETVSTAAERASKSIRKMKSDIERGTGPLREMGKLANSLFALGGATAAIALFGRVKSAVNQLVEAYKLQDLAVAKLSSTFASTGTDMSVTVAGLTDYAGALQQVTTFGDEATVSAMALLRGLTGLGTRGIKQLTPQVQDLAVGMFQGQLEPAMTAVAKTLSSSTNALGRYGIQIDMTGSQSEKLAQISEQLREKFGGMARAVGDTATASLVKLQNAQGDLREEAGRNTLLFFQPMIDGYRNIAAAAAAALKAQNDLMEAQRRQARGTDTAQDRIVLYASKIKELQEQLTTLLPLQAAGHLRAVGQAVSGQQVKDIQAQIEAYGRAISALRQKAAADAEAADEANAARQGELTFLDRLEDAYGRTREGKLAALRADITYWETARAKYQEHAGEIRSILLPLYEELRKATVGATINLRNLYGLEQRSEAPAPSLSPPIGLGNLYGMEERALEGMRQASINVANQFALLERQASASMSRIGKATQSTADQIVANFRDMLWGAEDWVNFLAYNAVDAIGTSLMGIGQMIVTGASAWSIFKKAALNACAAVLEALGQQLLAWAVLKAIMFQFGQAALATAGAIAAFVAAGAIRAAAGKIDTGDEESAAASTTATYGGAGGAGLGSQTTVQRIPDIYITINVHGSVFGPGGLQQVGGEMARALKEFAGVGGRIHIIEALAPVAG